MSGSEIMSNEEEAGERGRESARECRGESGTDIVSCHVARSDQESISRLPGQRPYSTRSRSIPPGLIRSVLILPSNSSTTGDVAADFVFKDTKGHAYTGYGIKEDGLQFVVVRPDGVIGAFVGGVDGVNKYFSPIFGN